ncbi:iron chaperone [Chitinophaga caseinilytica]|uniref:iron chaperone n=1 Tax=Chitinophaga caseinilytica TaxID=2267521 RepID=UPI003C2EA2A3
MAKTDFKTIDQYISTFDAADQAALTKIRQAIRKAAPNAEEVISYQIPAYKENGYVIYFSGFKEHYSLAFPPPFTVFEVFAKELAPYQQSKSVVQLPKGSPLPLDLIGRMVKFRLEEAKNSSKLKPKPAAKKADSAASKAKPAAAAKPKPAAKKASTAAPKAKPATKAKKK